VSVSLLVLGLALAVVIGRLLLDGLNLSYQRRPKPALPAAFAGRFDEKRLQEGNRYNQARGHLGLLEDAGGSLVTIAFIFSGLLSWYDQWVVSLTSHGLIQGLLFFLLLGAVQVLWGVPFSLYRNFVLEARFGFNRMSLSLWCSDLIKSLLIGAVLFSVLVGGSLWLIETFPHSWWLWVWVFWACLSLFLLYVSPVLIEPFFFKMTPLQDRELETQVGQLLKRAGLEAGTVLQVDASRRSGHSNAYFTGIGRVKRVVFFDTLLNQLNHTELLAVLAHELGHWQRGHIRQRLIKGQVAVLFCCYAAFWLLQQQVLSHWFGIAALSLYGQIFLLAWLGGLIGFFWSPISSWWSRRQEWDADRFARNLVGGGDALATGLVKLASENLSQLYPHPLYAWFYYSHPPLLERVAALESHRKGSSKK